MVPVESAIENTDYTQNKSAITNKYILLAGDIGVGKSTFLCNLAKISLQQAWLGLFYVVECIQSFETQIIWISKENARVFYHFFDASANASFDECMASRFVKYFAVELGSVFILLFFISFDIHILQSFTIGSQILASGIKLRMSSALGVRRSPSSNAAFHNARIL
jgi:hypothetical protein